MSESGELHFHPPARPLVAPDTGWADLASGRLGGRVLEVSDDFFAPAERLVSPTVPELREGLYTDRGKWMDGWESRRRRGPGHDWCVLRLAFPGRIRRVLVDTSHFRGNQPEACSLEGCLVHGEDPGDPPGGEEEWTELLARSPLQGDARNLFDVRPDRVCTHVRLGAYPDGGIARLTLWGEPRPEWERLAAGGPVDLAALAHGGRVLGATDRTFSSPENLLLPGGPEHMGEGWETRRRRGPGHDRVVVRLGHRGRIEEVEVDTRRFRGNYPESFLLEGVDAPSALPDRPPPEEADWRELVARTELGPDRRERFSVRDGEPFTHVRFHIFPDGGVARLRVMGRPETGGGTP